MRARAMRSVELLVWLPLALGCGADGARATSVTTPDERPSPPSGAVPPTAAPASTHASDSPSSSNTASVSTARPAAAPLATAYPTATTWPTATPLGAAASPATSTTSAAATTMLGGVTAPATGVLEPLPKAPPLKDAKRLEVLSSICSVAAFRAPTFVNWGCRSAPPFDGPDEQPDGQVLMETDPYAICGLDGFYEGSFSTTGKEQAVLGFAACGVERLNDISPGTAVLVERQAGRWRVLDVEPGTNVTDCKPSRRRDRTLLVCSDNKGAWGDGSLSWRFTLDFAAPPSGRIGLFAKLYESAGMHCSAGAESLVDRPLADVREVSSRLADLDGDGYDDLRVTIDRAYAGPSGAIAKKIEAACRKADGILDEKELLGGSYQRFTLDFKGTASGLVPTAATSKRLEEWGRAAPEFWWNVVQ